MPNKAIRDIVKPRYDLILPDFEYAFAMILGIGAEHYGELNYQQSRLSENRGPINHIKQHLNLYLANKEYNHIDVGKERKYHLAAIAVNAMIEFYYECDEFKNRERK